MRLSRNQVEISLIGLIAEIMVRIWLVLLVIVLVSVAVSVAVIVVAKVA